jgi:hypothetical protein
MMIAATATLVAGACYHREKTVTAVQSSTIAPATPPPTSPSDSDTSMTQTTEIGGERSPSEGGVLTEKETADTSAVTSTVVSTPTKKFVRSASKKHR